MNGFYDLAPNYRTSTDNINDEGIPGFRNIPKSLRMWRSTSLINLVSNSNRNRGPVYESVPFNDATKYGSAESLTTFSSYKSKKSLWLLKDLENFWDGWDTIVTIILVGAKELPRPPNDGASHELYAKFRLGSETFRSKPVLHTRRPEWRERFKLHLHKDHSLKLTLWDRGRQKIFMGRCIIDLSKLEKERTHDIWQGLDDGYGSVHLSVTMCVVRFAPTAPKTIKTDFQEQSHTDWNSDWRLVGCLKVKVIRAKGLNGKPSAYCTLELDNERLQTHTASSGSEPIWDKSFVFNVYDVTSVLILKAQSSSMTNAFLTEFLGQVSIPLLKITNGETRWYALKSRNNRNVARGNSPRMLLSMSVTWNPIKATLRLFQPKEVKYIEEPPKWDISLLMRNLPILVDTFNNILNFNEEYKRLFEWNNREISALALFLWLMLCYHLTPSTVLLILLLVFIYLRIFTWIQGHNYFIDSEAEIEFETNSNNNQKENKGLTYRINDMQEVIVTVSNVLALIVSLLERIKNLFTFQVPFLSYVVMAILALLSFVLYFLPFNYLLMVFGIYKFMRKYLNPDRILNNDLIDFISRIPDDRILVTYTSYHIMSATKRLERTERPRTVDLNTRRQDSAI